MAVVGRCIASDDYREHICSLRCRSCEFFKQEKSSDKVKMTKKDDLRTVLIFFSSLVISCLVISVIYFLKLLVWR